MRRPWAAALLLVAACGGGDDGPSGQAGPDDPSATTLATTPTTTTTTIAPTTTAPTVAPGPLAGRLDPRWLVGRVRASGARDARGVPVAAPEVSVAFSSADAGEPFAVVAGPTSQVGPPVLGPVSGLGSTEQIGDVQVRVYSGQDPDRPGTNLELAAFRCRDLSVRLVGRNLAGLGEVVSVTGRLVNALGCNS